MWYSFSAAGGAALKIKFALLTGREVIGWTEEHLDDGEHFCPARKEEFNWSIENMFKFSQFIQKTNIYSVHWSIYNSEDASPEVGVFLSEGIICPWVGR